MVIENPWAELGVVEGAPLETVKEAYFRLAGEYHPDRNPDGEAVMKRVNRAYDMLCDAAEMDAWRDRRLATTPPPPPPVETCPHGFARDLYAAAACPWCHAPSLGDIARESLREMFARMQRRDI